MNLSEVEKREATVEVKVVFQSENNATDESIRRAISRAMWYFGRTLRLREVEVFADIHILPSEQPKNGDRPRVRIVCSSCGSEDAVLVTAFGSGHYCNACDGPCSTKEVPLEG
jgi:predicted TIM-barrel enzyme